MPAPKIFVASTCYDLGPIRERVRNFILELGYEPIMSEYSDILYSPQKHTHSSCLNDMPNADVLILLVGSRFGGKGVPQALNEIDIDRIVQNNCDISIINNLEDLSITQLEVLKAIESSIPIYAFIDYKVWHDHLVFQKNREMAETIKFPSIEKQETAEYIFNFIDFLRKRKEGNAIIPFEKIEDIENHLKKQWAGLFQQMLKNLRMNQIDDKKNQMVYEQIEDLKTVLLSTFKNSKTRDIARGVIRYRRIIEFLRGLEHFDIDAVSTAQSGFASILENFGVKSVVFQETEFTNRTSEFYIINDDDSFYEVRGSEQLIIKLSVDWQAFINLDENDRKLIIETILENELAYPYLRYHRTPFSKIDDEKIKTAYQNTMPIGEIISGKEYLNIE